MNDRMYEDLLSLSNSRDLVSVYTDIENTESFYVGFVAKINEEDIIIQHIDPAGQYDGYILKKTSSIFQIGYRGLYENKIRKLYNMQAKKHHEMVLDDCLVLSLLKFAKQQNLVVSLELNNSGVMDIQGFVEEFDQNNIRVNLLTEYGVNDGFADVDVDCISRIDCDTDREQILKAIH